MSSVKDVLIGGAIIGASFGVRLIPGVGGPLGNLLFWYGTTKLIQGISAVGGGGGASTLAVRIQGTQFNTRSTQMSIPVIYGIQRIGLKVFDYRLVDARDEISPNADPTAFFAGADNDDVLCKVGAFCVGSEDGTGIGGVDKIRVYADGVDAVVSPSAFSSAPSVVGVIDKYSANLKYILEDGDDAQNTRTELEDALGWSSNMNAAGIAYGAFFFLHDQKVWDRGVPQITAEVTGNKVYDPRTSTWIGYAASGPSSDNGALCVLDYLTSKRYGSGVPYAARDGGSLDFVDEQSFIDAANYCDDLVSIPGAATEKRFRTNAVVSTARQTGANLADLLANCRGELVWQGGTYRLIIRQVTTAEAFELTEDNIVGDIEWARKGTSVPNLIEASFPDAVDGDYVANSVTWPLVGDTTFLDEDNGLENRAEVQLPYSTSYFQVLRTIMVLLREARNDVFATITAHQSAMDLQVGEVVKVTHQDPGWTQLEFMVRQMVLTHDGLVRVALQQYTAGAYTLDTLNARPSTPTFNLPDPLRPKNSLEFLYERPQSQGPSAIFEQEWQRELSWVVGSRVQSAEIVVGAYTLEPTLDSGDAVGTVVPGYRYHVDMTPNTSIVDFLKNVEYARDDTPYTAVDSFILLDNTNNGVAQNFVAGSGLPVGELVSMEVELQRTGNPTGDIVMKLYSDSASLPNALLATSYVQPANVVKTTVNDFVEFSFPAGFTLVDGTTYHAAVEYSAGDASNYIGVGVDAGGGVYAGTSKILNGSWVENGPADMPVSIRADSGNAAYGVRYDENNLLVGGTGPIDLELTPHSVPGGQPHRAGSRGIGTGQFSTKDIVSYDDMGARFFERADRRVALGGEAFGSPGPGPNDLDLDNNSNGFAFDYTPSASHFLGQVSVYLKKTGSPTGSIVAKVYGDSGGLPGTLADTSEVLDVSTLPSSYDADTPTDSGGFVFAVPVKLINATLHHISIEYSGGTATDFVSIAAETSGGNDELNGSWAAGSADQITWRVYSRENIERIARTALPGPNLGVKLLPTGDVEIDGVPGTPGPGGSTWTYFDPLTFGVTADGVTDDTFAYQTALDAAGVAGGIVQQPQGTCMVTQIRIPEKVINQGHGWSSIFKQIANTHTVDFSGTASGGSSNTLQDTGAGWTVNEHVGKTIHIKTGTGAAQVAYIGANTSDTLTLVYESGVGNFSWTAPDGTSTYDILDPIHVIVVDGPNTEHLVGRDFSVDGNKANQFAFNAGVFLDFTGGSWTSNDQHAIMSNIRIFDTPGSGVLKGNNMREGLLHKIWVKDADRHSIFTHPGGGTDNMHTQCTSEGSGLAGFVCNGDNDRWEGCKSFGSGAVSVGSQMAGYLITGDGVHISTCDAQENFEDGFFMVGANKCSISVRAFDNDRDGVRLSQCNYNTIIVTAAGDSGLGKTQDYAVGWQADQNIGNTIIVTADDTHGIGATHPSLEADDNIIITNGRYKHRMQNAWGTKGSSTNEHFLFGKATSPAANDPYFGWKTTSAAEPLAQLFGYDGTTTRVFMELEHASALVSFHSDVDVAVAAAKKLHLDGGGDTYIEETAPGLVRHRVQGVITFSLETGGISVLSLGKVFLDNRSNTYLVEVSADVMQLVVGGNAVMNLGTTYAEMQAARDFRIQPTNKLHLDGNGDTYLKELSANVIEFVVAGASNFTLGASLSGPTTDFDLDSLKKLFLDGGGDSYLWESAANTIQLVAGGAVGLFANASGGGVAATQKLFVDGGGDTYIIEGVANRLDFYAQAVKSFSVGNGFAQIESTSGNATLFVNQPAAAASLIEFQRLGLARWVSGASGNTDTNDYAFFRYNNAGTFQGEALRLNRSNGDAIFENDIIIASGTKFLPDGDGDTFIQENSANVLRCVAGGSGGVDLTSGATAWAAVSDESFKTDFKRFENPLVLIAQIRGGIGRYHTDHPSMRRSFLIAQDVKKVLPEAVTVGPDGKLSLRYVETIPLLVEAIHALNAEIQLLKG